MTTTFGMFVKRPVPGQVKTRLAASIGDKHAADLYGAFLEDLTSRFRDIAARRVLAYSPDDELSREFFMQLGNGAYELWPQPDGALGQRMDSFFQKFGSGPAVLIGSDSPTLERPDVESALKRLETVDCVLGPATDGGVYLIGLKNGPWPIFENVTWSTSLVLEQLLAEVQKVGATIDVLRPWYDVDTLDDLNFLRGHLAALKFSRTESGRKTPRTESVLDVISKLPPL